MSIEIVSKICQAFHDIMPEHQGPLTIEHNPQKLDQQSVRAWTADSSECWASDEERDKCYKSNDMWMMVWFPTMSGYCKIFASSLDQCFQAMYASELERLEQERPKLIIPSNTVKGVEPPKLIIK